MNRRQSIVAGTALAVLASGGGITALLLPAGSGSGDGAGDDTAASAVTALPPDPNAAPPRIKAVLNSVDVAAADVPQRDTQRFSLLGVTWTDPAARPAGAVEVRTRGVARGRWSAWRTLEVSDNGPDSEAATPGRRGGTEPLWVGDSDGVAVRVAGRGVSGVPAGMRLDLIDPGAEPGGRGGGEVLAEGESPSPSVEPSETVSTEPSEVTSTAPEESDSPAAPSSAPVGSVPASSTPSSAPVSTSPTAAPTSTVPVKAQFPAYISRKSWSADETIVGTVPITTEVKGIWLHHTATDDYTCDQSAAIVRSIQKYDVKSNNWPDLGYNYLVDKCGNLFEGTRGGVENAVVGTHTRGFNTGYAAIAVIGNYQTLKSNDAIENIVAQVAAARLGKYGYNPTSIATFKAGVANDKFAKDAEVTIPRLSGHRDLDATLCPGANLYPRLEAIRTRSVQQITGLAGKSLTGGLSVNGAYYVRTAVSFDWVVSTPSAQIATFEVLRDGKVAATLPGTARTSGSIAVTPGQHSIQVRATHVAGGTALTASYKVVADVTAPALSGPTVVLRTGTVSATSAPITVGYKASDNTRLYTVIATKPVRANLPPAGTTWAWTAKPGTSVTYTITAKDASGNSRTVTVARKVALLADTSAKKTGTWTAKSSSGYLSGKALATTKKNSKLTYAFTGRSAALIFSRGPATGRADVYLDGKKVATVDTKASSTTYRQALWVKSLTAGKHTVMVVALGTTGRPTVVSDGLAYVG